jgi:flagellar motility protein MotE (MotC chaperone)
MFRFRLIPTTIAAAMFFMVVKVVDVVRGTEAISQRLLISSVQAGPTTPPPKEIPKPAAQDASKETKKEEAKDAAKDGKDAKAETKAEEPKQAAEPEPSPPNKDVKISETPPETVDDTFSEVQLELLQRLSERRQELERWEANIEIKENTLDATEKRINNKIAQIEAMKSEVAELLKQYNEKEDAKIKSLVKIYENMKPEDAARIFDEVEMPILLLVIDKMSEKKVAPILAGMDSQKAKALTVQLAEQRRVNSARLTGFNNP